MGFLFLKALAAVFLVGRLSRSEKSYGGKWQFDGSRGFCGYWQSRARSLSAKRSCHDWRNLGLLGDPSWHGPLFTMMRFAPLCANRRSRQGNGCVLAGDHVHAHAMETPQRKLGAEVHRAIHVEGFSECNGTDRGVLYPSPDCLVRPTCRTDA